MSDETRFGIPGTGNEWLAPEDEQKILERLQAIRNEQERSGYTDHEDIAWLTLLAGKLLEARMATRSAVTEMAQTIRDYEQGQGILGATPKRETLHTTTP